jgi:hypothetical protein
MAAVNAEKTSQTNQGGVERHRIEIENSVGRLERSLGDHHPAWGPLKQVLCHEVKSRVIWPGNRNERKRGKPHPKRTKGWKKGKEIEKEVLDVIPESEMCAHCKKSV